VPLRVVPPCARARLILVYVEDIIGAGETLAGIAAVKRSGSANCDLRDIGEVNNFIGMKVMRDPAARKLTLRNPGHTATLLEAFGNETFTWNKAPMASGVQLPKTGKDLLPEGTRYADFVGSLLYLCTTTRPDISFAVGVLSRFMSCSEQDHMRTAKGVLRYLRGTTRLGVLYGGSEPLQGFVDADWERDVDGSRSTTGFVFTLNGGPIAWASKRQSTVATSTAEAEYVASAMEREQARWLRKLLSAPGVDGEAVPTGEDNQACLALVNNPEATGSIKHVDVTYHSRGRYRPRRSSCFGASLALARI